MRDDSSYYQGVWERAVVRAARAEIKGDLISFIQSYGDDTSDIYDGSKSSLEIEYIESQREFLQELKPLLIECIKNKF